MLQISQIKDNQELVINGLEKRGLKDAESIVKKVLDIDQKRKGTQLELDTILAEQNAVSKNIGLLMKEGKSAEAGMAKEQTAKLKSKSKALGETLTNLQESLRDLLYTIPNIPHQSVVKGYSEDDNEVLFEVGVKPTLHKGAKPHWDLIKELDIVDFELGNKVSGAGFPFYKGKGARLQRALVNFFLDEATKAGYNEVQTPIVINEASGYATGQLPDKEGQMYRIEEEGLYLIPTAEVPITNMYRNVIVKEGDLPIKNVGFTPCFRREAGSWGAHVRGLNRLHQFDKVEIVQVQHPDKSYQALEEMSDYIQGLLIKLELPFRVLRLCSDDLGFTAALTFDMEVYSAGQNKWLEVSSVSNFEAYQTNRLKLRYKDGNNKTQLLHTLNGSALALPRILASLLENNQTEEGIKIPEVLVPYTGFTLID